MLETLSVFICEKSKKCFQDYLNLEPTNFAKQVNIHLRYKLPNDDFFADTWVNEKYLLVSDPKIIKKGAEGHPGGGFSDF